MDEVRTLPPTPQRVAQKANLSFKNRLPYISVLDEASDFKFGMQLGFAKAHHKITRSLRRRKGGRGAGPGELTKIWGFHFNIYTMVEARDFEFGTQLGFAKAHHKTTSRGKVNLALGLGSSHIFGVPL